MQLEIFPDRMHLCRDDPSRNMRRFYLMAVQRDLFGGASLIREWGRLGRSGQVRIDHHPDEGRAIDALAELATVKRKRGYR
jgi:predicted DNA-binding WGR domain protein